MRGHSQPSSGRDLSLRLTARLDRQPCFPADAPPALFVRRRVGGDSDPIDAHSESASTIDSGRLGNTSCELYGSHAETVPATAYRFALCWNMGKNSIWCDR